MDNDEEEDYTTDSNIRYKYTNDRMAIIFTVSVISWVTYLLVQGMEVPVWLRWPVAIGFITAIVWSFGKGIFSTALDAVKGK